MEDLKTDLITGGIAIAITVVIVSVICLACDIHEKNVWNNGYHTCGGQWQYQQPIGHMYHTSFMYECDKCGKIYEFDSKR